jgi:DNA-binding SARP family transcriptional activator
VNTRASIALRLAALLSVAALVAVLALAWDLRPSLPPLPQSFSAPLPSSTISRTLDLAAWIVFVLLDLVLLMKVMKLAIQRTPRRSALRLRRAFAAREKPTVDDADWRKQSAPLAPPVLLLPTRHDVEPPSTQVQADGEALPEVAPAHAAVDDRSEDRAAIRLLGPFELIGCKKKQPRRQATVELIAYLAIQRRPVNRDELLEALWPDDDPRRSAARFYQAASEARKLLGDAFLRARDTYNLDRQQLEIDLDELDGLREQARTDEEHESALFERALALFRGEPFAGIDAFWADSERCRLTSIRLSLLERVGRLRLEFGDAVAALEVADEAAALDGSNEHIVQLAIEAEAALGRRDAVTKRYERLCRHLDDRFGLEPNRDTRLLYRRLLSQDAQSSLEGVDPGGAAFGQRP